MSYLGIIALISGAAISVQAALNAQLGGLLKSSLLATGVAFASSVIFVFLSMLVLIREYPSINTIRSVPVYLWVSGGLLSAFAISMFYYLIPKMGIGQMMSFALTGQLTVAVVAGHFGWFDLPIKPLSTLKMIGIAALLLGVILINKE